MKNIFLVKYLFVILLACFTFGLTPASAQSPCPTVGPCDEPTPSVASPTPAPSPGTNTAVTFSAMLEEMVTNFVIFKDAFANTIENTLGGYFGVLAYILAWIIAVAYFIQQAYRGEWDGTEILPFIGRIVICLVLLVFCGDVDGDGKRGDVIRGSAYIGYLLAYGGTANEPTGSFINKMVDEQSTKFNKNYQSFVENKLMVKINGQEYPVKYPGMKGITTVAAVYTGQGSIQQEKETQSQEFWIGLEFQILNVCRSIIAVIDFFLLALYSFGVLLMITIAPFMVCVFVNRELAKRFTYPFFWTVLTICIVFPALSQAARFFSYLAGNIALGTSANPIYTYDPKTYTIISNGDPTPMILVAILFMCISIVCLAMSVILSYSLVQGRLIETVSGLIANTFAGLSSVGMTGIIGAYTSKLQTEGGKAGIEGAEQATLTRSGFNLEAQRLSAQNAKDVNDISANSGYTSSLLNAEGSRQSSQMSALGSYLGGMASTEASRVGTINGAVSSFKHNLANLGTEEKQAVANNFADYLMKNNDDTSKKMADELRLHPEKLDLLAESYENVLNGIPVVGSVAKTLGMNKDSFNAWMRTDGVKTVGQWMLGNPETGQLPSSFANKVTGITPPNAVGDETQQQMIYGNNGTTMFQRPDGTVVNAVTGQVVSQSSATTGQIFSTNSPQLQPDAKNFLASLNPKERRILQGNQRNLQQLMKNDPNFLPTVQAYAAKRNLNPNDVLNLFAIESSFNKQALNSDGYLGIAQVGRKERQSIGWSGNDATDLARVSNMSATQQLNSLVFPFMEKKLGSKLNGAKLSTLYAAWGSGHAKGDPNAIHMVNGGLRSTAYNKNPGWDVNKDGKVQEWEFGQSPLKRLGAGILFDANQAKGQIRTPRVTQTPRVPQIGQSITGATQVPKIGQNYGNSAKQVNSVVSTNSQPVPFYDQKSGVDKINKANNPATQKIMAKQVGIDSEFQNTSANNQANMVARNQIVQQANAEKRINEQNFANEQINNANQVAGIQAQGLQATYSKQIEGSNIQFGYQQQAASVTRDSSFQTGQMNYSTALKTADLQYLGESKAAEITKNSSLEQLYKQNLASLVQTVGNSAAHQFSELFERASKGL